MPPLGDLLEDKVIADLLEGGEQDRAGDPGLLVITSLVEASKKVEDEHTI